MQKRKHTGGMGLYLIGGGIYIGLLILFGFQTWQFVDWLFPNDQLLMKILTVLCFDVMALFWACADLFYRFASRGARSLVRWAWAISFLLSLLASIFYLVIESMFRFQVTITQTTVNIGYGVTIFALTLNILFLTFWLYLEWAARHPYQDEYVEEAPEPEPRALSPHSPLAQSVGQTNNTLYHAWRDASIEERQAIMNTYLGHSTPVQDEQQLSPEEQQRRFQWIMENVPMLGQSSPLASPASLHQNGHVTPEQPKE